MYRILCVGCSDNFSILKSIDDIILTIVPVPEELSVLQYINNVHEPDIIIYGTGSLELNIKSSNVVTSKAKHIFLDSLDSKVNFLNCIKALIEDLDKTMKNNHSFMQPHCKRTLDIAKEFFNRSLKAENTEEIGKFLSDGLDYLSALWQCNCYNTDLPCAVQCDRLTTEATYPLQMRML